MKSVAVILLACLLFVDVKGCCKHIAFKVDFIPRKLSGRTDLLLSKSITMKDTNKELPEPDNLVHAGLLSLSFWGQ
ncbi:hypothetical protein JZ751_012412, partial [Albula glossodonta]